MPHLAYLDHLAAGNVRGTDIDLVGLRSRQGESLARTQRRFWRGFKGHLQPERILVRDGEREHFRCGITVGKI